MKFIFTTLIVLLFLASNAQQYGGSIYIQPGIQLFAFKNLDQSLTQAGFGSVPVSSGTGIGGYGVSNNWVIGGEGTYFSGVNTNSNSSTSISGGWGFFYAGYAISKNKWQVTPALGIGYGGCTVNAARATQASSLDALLSTQPNSSQISIGDGLLHTALTLNRSLSDQLYLGLKVSYQVGLSGNKSWEADGLNDSTTDSFSGLSIGLLIGFKL